MSTAATEIIPFGFRRAQPLGFFHAGSLHIGQFVKTLPDGTIILQVIHDIDGNYFCKLRPDQICWSENMPDFTQRRREE